jgi:hypothetical protein
MGDLDICKGAICQYGADVLQSSNPYFNGTLHFYDFNGTSAPHWTGLDSRWVLLYVPENESLPEYFRF